MSTFKNFLKRSRKFEDSVEDLRTIDFYEFDGRFDKKQRLHEDLLSLQSVSKGQMSKDGTSRLSTNYSDGWNLSDRTKWYCYYAIHSRICRGAAITIMTVTVIVCIVLIVLMILHDRALARAKKSKDANDTMPTTIHLPFWSQWSSCDHSCGKGQQWRTINNCTRETIGCDSQRKQCKFVHCPIDGGWTQWSPWSLCTATCGYKGTSSHFRQCASPAPQYGGNPCKGRSTQSYYCPSPDVPCPTTTKKFVYTNPHALARFNHEHDYGNLIDFT